MHPFRPRFLACLALLLGPTPPITARAAEPEPIRVYSHLLEPREHPDDDRRAVRPPDWDTFGRRTRFTTLRGFNVEADRITGYSEELEKFTRTHDLGEVIWPSYPILFAQNLGDLADEIRRRDLYLFDVWGYVPGSGPGGYWQQFRPPADAFRMLEAKLGERWLGTDIGEQDGRYIGGYANQMTPASAGRFAQYLNFQRHFERMGDDLGHRHATLVSLNFGHYLLKEGTYTLIGAETAQALPNNQVYYSFIRGAGKQYGVPWFGNASVYNRWGFKNYAGAGRGDGYDYGPTKGSSLSLLKRLLYSHILGNSVAVGYENMWFDGEKLSPLGRIQQSAHRWVRQNGSPGVMHTPVALLLDFESGWSFPRHLYSDKIFRVWGNIPYDSGDQLTDSVLDLLYPGYSESSYYHDETGFITPTPYGDIADCLLSDAPSWLLDRYPVLVVAGELKGGAEIADKLRAYATAGGRLFVTSGNLAKLPGGLAGLTQASEDVTLDLGRGTVTVFKSRFGVEAVDLAKPPRSEVDQPLPRPYRLDASVRRALEAAFASQRLFEVRGEGLSLVTCRRGPGEYVLGIANNTWRPQPFAIRSLCGSIETSRELTLDTSERTAPGFTPEGIDATAGGTNTDTVIAGGDLRVFALRVAESGVVEIPHRRPPPRPRGRYLPLANPGSLKEAVLARPTFFQHYDGVSLDWRYLHVHERSMLASESAWIARQGLKAVVDLSSGVDLYPTLRLINNDTNDYNRTLAIIEDLLVKMPLVHARDLMLSLHRHPENNLADDQARSAFEATLRDLCAKAAARQVTVHLRLAFGKPPWNLEDGLQWLERIQAPNLRLAPSTALVSRRAPPEGMGARLAGKVGIWCVAAARYDVTGALWDAHAPLSGSVEREVIAKWTALTPGVPLVSDAAVADQDGEYQEALELGALNRDDHR